MRIETLGLGLGLALTSVPRLGCPISLDSTLVEKTWGRLVFSRCQHANSKVLLVEPQT